MNAEEGVSIAAPPSKVRAVRSFFEDPKRYLHGRGFDVKLRAETVQEVTRDLAFQSFIDIGCGNGTISLPLLQADNRLTLLDLSTSMTKLAGSNVPAALKGNVTFINQDFMDAEFAPNSFDLVICIGVLAHVDSPAEFLKKLNRVLKPGGSLVLEFTDCKHFMGRLLRAYQWVCALRKPRTYPLNAFSARGVRALLGGQPWKLKTEYRYGLPPFPIFGKMMSQDTMYKVVRNLFGNATRNTNTWLGNEYLLLLTNEKRTD